MSNPPTKTPPKDREQLDPVYALIEEWRALIDVPWDDVWGEAGIVSPTDGNRQTRKRLKEGVAPRARKQVIEALAKLEGPQGARAAVGRVLLGIEEWGALGQRLAIADRDAFLKMLETLREIVKKAEDQKKATAGWGQQT